MKGDTDFIKDMVQKNGGRMTPQLMDKIWDETKKNPSPQIQAMARASAAAVMKKADYLIIHSHCHLIVE